MAARDIDTAAILALLDADPDHPEVGAYVETLAYARAFSDAAARARAAVNAGAARGPVYLALARGLFRAGRADRCLAILEHLPPEERATETARHLHIQALLEAGRDMDARKLAEMLVVRRSDDDVALRLLGRVRPERPARVAGDPTHTVRRAERMMEAGHLERAVRVLRVILNENPRSEVVRRVLRSAVEQSRRAKESAGAVTVVTAPSTPISRDDG